MSNLAASVRARLLNVAKAQHVDFAQVLMRFALERMLYRLTQLPPADRFLLEGALLFTLWYDLPHRPTRDADLLGFGASDAASVAKIFREIAAIIMEDGIVGPLCRRAGDPDTKKPALGRLFRVTCLVGETGFEPATSTSRT